MRGEDYLEKPSFYISAGMDFENLHGRPVIRGYYWNPHTIGGLIFKTFSSVFCLANRREPPTWQFRNS